MGAQLMRSRSETIPIDRTLPVPFAGFGSQTRLPPNPREISRRGIVSQ